MVAGREVQPLKKRNVVLVLLLILPLVGAFTLYKSLSSAALAASRAHPRIVRVAPVGTKLQDVRLFDKKGKNLMPQAIAVKVIIRNETFPYPARPAVSAFVDDAPFATDLTVGDTTTGYDAVLPTGSPGPMSRVFIMVDLGASPPSVGSWRYTMVPDNAGMVLYSSTDGTTWTQQDIGGGTSDVQTPIGPITARYWLFQCTNNGAPGSTVDKLTDTRLYTGAGVIIDGPTPLPSTLHLMSMMGCGV